MNKSLNEAELASLSLPLEACGLSLDYGHSRILDRLSLRLPAQQVTAIVGPNGCGKSTLLAGLARLHKPAGGEVLLNGRDINRLPSAQVARQMALLPQEMNAPEGMTAYDLIRFGRQPHQGLWRQWSQEDAEIVDAALTAADIVDLAERPLDEMSGGQRQRAWIAMAIAQATPLLLLDEPTAALDLGHQIEVFELIRNLCRQQSKTVIMVVHDLVSAARYADHLVAMKNGKVVATGSPTKILTPELVYELYGVRCQLITDPVHGSPLIVGVERAD